MAEEREHRPYATTAHRHESPSNLCPPKKLSIPNDELSEAERSELKPISTKTYQSLDCHKKEASHWQRMEKATSNRFSLPAEQTVFHLKKLPQELRMKIYAHELYHLPMAKEPALLQALAKDKHLLDDYARALRLWEYGGMHNFKVTSVNVDAFHRMPMKEMLKIKHLTIVVDTVLTNDNEDIFRKLKSNKAQLKNNFESIIIDLYQHASGAEVYGTVSRNASGRDYLIQYAQYCVAASSQPYRVFFRMSKDHDPAGLDLCCLRWGLRRIIKPIDDHSGFLWIWDNGNRMLREV